MTELAARPVARDWQHGTLVIAHVVAALVLREIKTRFGRHAGGYLWAIAEPLLYVAVFLMVGALFTGSSALDGGNAADFAAGVLAFMLFRDVVKRAMAGVPGNRGLLMHPVVTPLDIVIARTLLTAATSLVVTCLVAGGIAALLGGELPAEPLRLFGVLLVAAWFGFGFGLLCGAAAAVWPVTERIVAPAMRLGFFLSGVFYPPASLPPELRDILLWNPLLHVTEAARLAWLAAPPEAFGTLFYPIAVAWAALPVGLAAERLARTRIAAS